MKKVYLFLLAVICLSIQTYAQRTITGKVTDDKGNPVANVSVLVKGTKVGTVTKEDGSYTISTPQNGGTLVFSSVDYAQQEMAIGTSSLVSVSLASLNLSLIHISEPTRPY